MLSRSIIFLVTLFGVLYACVQVKPKVEFPCKVCQRLYNTSCQGLDPNDISSCYTTEQAKVKYRLGLHPTSDRLFIPPGSCTMDLKCPGSSQLWPAMDRFGGANPVAWCEESGSSAGQWFAGRSWLLRIEMGGMYDVGCRDPDYSPVSQNNYDETDDGNYVEEGWKKSD